MLMGAKAEMSMSEQAQVAFAKQHKFEKGTSRAARVTRIGKRIAAVADRDDFEWEFHVVIEKTQNAMSLPGGKVYFFTGLLDLLGKDDAHLAAIMGHEVAHAILRHGSEKVSHNILAISSTAIIGIILSARTNGEIDSRQVADGGMQLANWVFLLPYSRTLESEADHVGAILMAKAGYDPRKAITVWEKLEKAQKDLPKPPVFLSTHPPHADRIAYLQEVMPEIMQYYKSTSNHEHRRKKLNSVQ